MSTALAPTELEHEVQHLRTANEALTARLHMHENFVTTIRAHLANLPSHAPIHAPLDHAEVYRLRDKNTAARLHLAALLMRYPYLKKPLERVLLILAE
jgi:hypothetical protein